MSYIILFCSLFITVESNGGSDPSYVWRTLVTDHFRINYHQGGELFAKKVATIAENVYRECSAFLGLIPRETVEIVITDDVDDANGFASVYPYDVIRILAFPPDPKSELAYYDDYIKLLVYHEYVHIVHMDSIGGVPGFITDIFGKIIVPNGAIHQWFVEGLATFAETRLTNGGRVGSPIFDMYLRVAALNDRLLDISEISDWTVKFPRGAVPYLYGGYFFDFLYQRYGTGPITKFIKNYGSRIIPFAINTLAKRHFGANFESLYEDFLNEIRKKAISVQARVKEEGECVGTLLTSGGEYNLSPVFSNNQDSIFFIRSDGKSTTAVYEMSLYDNKMRKIIDCYGGCDGLYLTKDNYLITSHLNPIRIYRLVGDLWKIDPKQKKEQQITDNARARDGCMSEDGLIYYVSSAFDSIWIVEFDPKTKQGRKVTPSGFFSGIGNPRPIPNSNKLVFTGAREGKWDIWMLDLEYQLLTQLTNDQFLDRDPFVTRDGRFIFFSSDRGGIFNIFAINLETRGLYQITNVIGGAFEPSIDLDSRALVYSIYGPNGYDIALLSLDKSKWTYIETLPIFVPYVIADSVHDHNDNMETIAKEEIKDTTYSAFPSIRPRTIRPHLSIQNFRPTLIGAEVSAFDAINRHSYLLSTDIELPNHYPTLLISYGYHGWWSSMFFTFSTYPSQLFAFIDDNWHRFQTRSYQLAFNTGIPLPFRDRSMFVGFSYSLKWDKEEKPPVARDPASLQPKYQWGGNRSLVSIYAYHDSTEAFTWSVSPEKGFSIGTNLSLGHDLLDGSKISYTVGGSFDWFLGIPWFRGHAFALLTSGAFSGGDKRFRNIFVVGGLPQSNVMIEIMNGRPVGGRFLRGYPKETFWGDKYFLVNAEYRFPILYIYRGLGTLPLSARKLYGTVFLDTGSAWFETLDNIGLDVGAEISLSVRLFLAVEGRFRLGFAKGFWRQGDNVFYFQFSP